METDDFLNLETATHNNWDKLAIVTDDEHRPHLRNLHFARNDTLINEYEEELLLEKGGNIDFRALLNLWSVLEYLTKYNTTDFCPCPLVSCPCLIVMRIKVNVIMVVRHEVVKSRKPPGSNVHHHL